MYVFTLFLMLILLAFSFRAARGEPRVGRGLNFGGVALVPFGFLFCGVGFLPLAALFFAIALTVALEVRARFPKTFPSFKLLALTAFGVTFLAETIVAVPRFRQFEQMRADYPLESMVARVPAPTPAPKLMPQAVQRLDEAKLAVESESHSRLRRQKLMRLHQQNAWEFAYRPGFGVGRMVMSELTPSGLMTFPRGESPMQPGSGVRLDPESDTIPFEPYGLHLDALADFANPAGFGYVRDRDHVAGFQPHGFTRVPANTLERVELVSLLMHPEPAVYVSDHLPEMARLKGVPTRPLDEFESTGLANLRQGEDLFESSAHPTRLLGSLRNATQCVECHGGSRGDLLGAFSYTFR